MTKLTVFLMIFIFSTMLSACSKIEEKANRYRWQNVAESAAFPPGYNYPVFVRDNQMYALNQGAWSSKDGKTWTPTGLPEAGLNSAYQKYVQFQDAVYALGTMEGNYTNLRLTSKISRTRDFKTWETVAATSNLPERVFYGAVVFKDKIWLAGGYDGRNYYNDVWNSADAVKWRRVAERAAWSPRLATRLIVFRDRLWLLGGGVIDGEKSSNPGAEGEFWSSADGVNWELTEPGSAKNLGGTPIVFDDKLWLIGANRGDGSFSNALYVSADGADWQEQSAPWSPRGGAVVWLFGDKLYLTGGKYSEAGNGEIKFVYSNDVWALSRQPAEN